MVHSHCHDVRRAPSFFHRVPAPAKMPDHRPVLLLSFHWQIADDLFQIA
jgi:hypothetical protein